MNNDDKIMALESACDLINLLYDADNDFIDKIVNAIRSKDESDLLDMINDIELN